MKDLDRVKMCVTSPVCMKQHLIFHTMSCQLRVIRIYCFYRKWKSVSNSMHLWLRMPTAMLCVIHMNKCTEHCTAYIFQIHTGICTCVYIHIYIKSIREKQGMIH